MSQPACCLEKINNTRVSKRRVNPLAHAQPVPSASYHCLPLWCIAMPQGRGGIHTIILYELLHQLHQLAVTVYHTIFDLLGSNFAKKLPRAIDSALLYFP